MTTLHNRLVAHLVAAFAVAGEGDTSDADGDTLARTLATTTELQAAIATVARSARADEVAAARLTEDITSLQRRKDRLQVRAERKRQEALRAMVAAGPEFSRIEAHDVTVSVKTKAPALFVADPTVLPSEYFEPQPPKLKRCALLRDLKNGADIFGAEFVVGQQTLQISTR
jgi:hypothetical protein